MALKVREREVETPEVLVRPRYGIWGLAALFVLLATATLLVVLFLPSPQSETVELPSRRPASTLPGGAASGSASSGGAGGSAGSGSSSGSAVSGGGSGGGSSGATPAGGTAGGQGATAVTVPGGAPAPKGVTKVLATEGSTSYSFEVPASFRDERVRAAVPPATAVANGDGTQLLVRVSCSLVRNEVLAQVALSEGESVVTVLPVVLVPERGDLCPAGTELAQVVLPLATPLGNRQLFVAPAGTEVPTPG
ncbi:MAG: hypothetical protein ACKO04_12600 [Actinomycetes bacterium]